MAQMDIYVAAPRERVQMGTAATISPRPFLVHSWGCSPLYSLLRSGDPTSSGKGPAPFVATNQVSRMSRKLVNGPSGHFFVSRWPTSSGHPRYTKKITRSLFATPLARRRDQVGWP